MALDNEQKAVESLTTKESDDNVTLTLSAQECFFLSMMVDAYVDFLNIACKKKKKLKKEATYEECIQSAKDIQDKVFGALVDKAEKRIK